jgi:hypothetical protein
VTRSFPAIFAREVEVINFRRKAIREGIVSAARARARANQTAA